MGEGVLEMGWLMGSQATEMTFERGARAPKPVFSTKTAALGSLKAADPSPKRHFGRFSPLLSAEVPLPLEWCEGRGRGAALC